MKGKKVQNVSVTAEENLASDKEKHDTSTKEDDYEFLDNIDFLQHIDLSDYEQEIFSVENDTPKKEEEIKVNVDYLDDLAFFDELDYFEQLNKSLEEELKELDGPLTATTKLKTKHRWIKAHSDRIILGAGIGVFLVLAGGLAATIGRHLLKTGTTYASTGDRQVVEVPTNLPENQKAVDLVEQDKSPEETPHRSESLIQKRTQPRAINTAAPTVTAKAGEVKEVSTTVTEKELKEFFSDSVFIGNSLTEGLQLAGGVSSANYLAVKSLNVIDALKKPVIGSGSNKKTILEALSEINCKKVFVMFGLNELGWPYPNVFGDRYEQLMKKLKEVKPDATIYIQSILPCSKSLGEEDKVCSKSNIDAFNNVIRDAAQKAGCVYLDVGPAVAGGDGYLPEDASVDGMHLNKAYNRKWITYIYNQLK